ncbi:hypothetical protein [Marinimicrobium locisalis]|uniref:hypothetical protein n=1 Tax=Marinimicrobium locisalis TaxID=546022 RepID=UPI00322187C6
MSVFSELKHRICRFEMSPNFPVGGLVRWAERENLSPELLLAIARQVKAQLEVELEALQCCGKTSPATLIRHEYWCFYAEQVCGFYRALVHHPEAADRLALIEKLSGAESND